MPARIKRAKKELEIVSHNHVRRRDSKSEHEIAGYCFDCDLWSVGQQFQAGHFEPSGSCGAILRYHPHNMHGQNGGCNSQYQQEKVKVAYTLRMLDKYGRKYVDHLRQLKNKQIKADIIFYETMIELYKIGDESQIVKYLESL